MSQLEQTTPADRVNQYAKPVGFRGNRRFLSNFQESKITMGKLTFRTAEHAYQAAKSLDPADWKKIIACASPGIAKRVGKSLKLRPDWEEIKLHIMREIIAAKFDQNPGLRALLIGTGNEKLVEENGWGDTFWGMCNGVGQNHLGHILMEYRDSTLMVG